MLPSNSTLHTNWNILLHSLLSSHVWRDFRITWVILRSCHCPFYSPPKSKKIRRQLIKASEQWAEVAEGQLCVRGNCSMRYAYGRGGLESGLGLGVWPRCVGLPLSICVRKYLLRQTLKFYSSLPNCTLGGFEFFFPGCLCRCLCPKTVVIVGDCMNSASRQK